MSGLYMIGTIAVYEAKTLMRSWFFRIYAWAAVLFFGFFDFFALASFRHMDWEFKAIAGNLPYFNLLFLNTAQAVIAIFLAADFLKRDRKDDTTEVVYMRSMTNLAYVVGKTVGVLWVFLLVNLIVLGLSAIFTLTISEIPLVWQAYLWDLVLLSVPTLVYILGLSFLIMALIRNQAVTIVLLLGYVVTSTIFLQGKLFHLYDYFGFHLPFSYSDFGGFSDLTGLLIHRGAYSLLGVGFILLSSLRLQRLPQSRTSVTMTVVGAILACSFGGWLGYRHVTDSQEAIDLRRDMTELANTWAATPLIAPEAWDLDLTHIGQTIDVVAQCRYRNKNAAPLHEVVLSLNPGLDVTSVADGHGALVFERQLQIVKVLLREPMAPGAMDSLTLEYRGTIDERTCHRDIAEPQRSNVHRPTNLYVSEARQAWITPDYVLLLPTAQWYPVPGPGYASGHPSYDQVDFSRYHLNVTTAPGKTAVSQGRVTTSDKGRFTFEPEHPLPSLMLAIGNYDRRSVVVDSVQYNLYTDVRHDYFADYFTDLGDTLQTLIRDARQDFENNLGLTYPFARLNLVETPIHYKTYRHLWTIGQGTVWPEVVLLPENGASLNSADFKASQRRYKRRANRSNEDLNDREIQSKMLRRFMRNVFLGDYSPFRSNRDNDDQLEFLVSYSLFPTYYNHVYHLKSQQWPILNLALETYYSRRLIHLDLSQTRFFEGLVAEEKANLLLAERGLAEALADPQERELAMLVLEQKGEYLFKLLENLMGAEAFGVYLDEVLADNRYGTLALDDFLDGLGQACGVDLRRVVDDWYNTRSLPGFKITDFKTYKVIDQGRERFQVVCQLTNGEDVPGLVRIHFARETDDRDDESTAISRLVLVEPDQTRELGFVLDFQPEAMTVNTLVSRNIPVMFQELCSKFELDRKAVPFDGERVVDTQALDEDQAWEIIVDNEDPGFGYDMSPPANLLRQYLAQWQGSEPQKQEYVGFRPWAHMEVWKPTINAHYYGKYIRSAHYTTATGGDRYVWWDADMPTAGAYDLHFYVSRGSTPWWMEDTREALGQYSISVLTVDGWEETELDVKDAQDGWNYLGSYYLNEGQARVRLSNVTKGRYVLADAIKWVAR